MCKVIAGHIDFKLTVNLTIRSGFLDEEKLIKLLPYNYKN